MGYVEMPPAVGEIPHPFGIMPTPGALSCGVIPLPVGDVSNPPARRAGDIHIGGALRETNNPPAKYFGAMGNPPAVGQMGGGPCKGLIDNPGFGGTVETGP